MDGHGAAGAHVAAIANGAVTWAQGIGADGYLIVLVHVLPDSSRVWSAYWHVTQPVVPISQAVKREDKIADVFDRGANSHLRWKIRTFGDGASLFSRGSAGAGRATASEPPWVTHGTTTPRAPGPTIGATAIRWRSWRRGGKNQ